MNVRLKPAEIKHLQLLRSSADAKSQAFQAAKAVLEEAQAVLASYIRVLGESYEFSEVLDRAGRCELTPDSSEIIFEK